MISSKVLPKNDIVFYLTLFILVLSAKLLISGCFSSDYQNLLFIPFVNHFINFFDNPWQWAYTHQDMMKLEFPYHPLMLYTLSPFAFLIEKLSIVNIFWVNLLFKLPILIADLFIFGILITVTKNYKKSFYYYFCSPIILYAAYMHSQLDILPVTLIFASFYLLKSNKIWAASLLYALACCFKMNSVLLLPIFAIYLLKSHHLLKTICSMFLIFVIYSAISAPYIFSEGYQHLVLMNDKQNLFFNIKIAMGNVVVYIPLLCLLFIYLKFLSYKKISRNLLDAFCCLTNSIFLILVPPSSPAWFIWFLPFLCMFLINFSNLQKRIPINYALMNIIYILFFVFFHIGDYGDLTFLNKNINLKINHIFMANCFFTLLVAEIIAIMYFIYNTAIKNNAIYGKQQAIMIGISGDSGAGKTTLLYDLSQLFGDNLLTLEGDGAHKWQRGSKQWTEYTHLNPKANYLYEQTNELYELKHMRHVNYRHYNHDTGTFEIMKINPKQFIVMAGLHVFYLPKMRKLVDLKIYLNTDDNLRLYWKIKRDINERGYTADEVKKSFEKRKNDSDKYISPQKQFADMVITYFTDATFDNFEETTVKLRIDLDASIGLEDVINYLANNNIKYEWDYSGDLKMQYLIVYDNCSKNDLQNLINNDIANYNEFIADSFNIHSGLRGIVQVVILKMIVEKMKEKI